MTTLTDAEWNYLGNFAHRAHLFTKSMKEEDYSVALELAREYNLSDERVEAAAWAYASENMPEEDWQRAQHDPELIEPYRAGMRSALRAANEVGR